MPRRALLAAPALAALLLAGCGTGPDPSTGSGAGPTTTAGGLLGEPLDTAACVQTAVAWVDALAADAEATVDGPADAQDDRQADADALRQRVQAGSGAKLAEDLNLRCAGDSGNGTEVRTDPAFAAAFRQAAGDRATAAQATVALVGANLLCNPDGSPLYPDAANAAAYCAWHAGE
jgi:hypothetical protein